MSQYEADLKRRLEGIEATTRWYMERVIADQLEWRDLSVFEVQFWKQFYASYEQWKATRLKH